MAFSRPNNGDMPDCRLIVNVGGTSIKCTLFRDSTEQLDLRILGFGLKALWVYENRQALAFESSVPEDAITFAASRIVDFAHRHRYSITEVCHRIKYFRPSPSCIRIDHIALAEIQQYGFLQASHIKALLAALDIFMTVIPNAKHLAFPDHASLVGTGVLEVSKRLPPSMFRTYGLFAIPQHGFAVRSAVASLPRRQVASRQGTLVCHIGSGVTVSFIREGQLCGNSMMYSSCDGPLMTYRTGSLPAGIMLRLCTDYGGDPLHRIFTEGGLYASIDPDRATAISVAEIIDDPSYREQSQLYIASITEAIVCAVIAHGIPERFVFAGNLLTRSENLFSLLVDRLSVVLGRDAFRISDSEGLDVKKGENHWCFSYVSINEETVMQAEAEGLQSSETDTSSMVEQFHDDVDLVFRLRAIIGYKDEFFASIKQRILQSEYETLILSPTGCFSVFDMLSPKDGPQLGEPNTHTLYVDRKNKFLHMFSYKDPVNLAD